MRVRGMAMPPAVPVLAVCVPMDPVRDVGASARRVNGGPPEREQRGGHRISLRPLHSSKRRFYPLLRWPSVDASELPQNHWT